ncbi:MAG: phage tail protein, partial [Verrucomicrobiota bacterium]
GCMPVNLEVGSLNASSSEPVIETLELVASDLTMSFPGGGNPNQLETKAPSNTPRVHQGYRFGVGFLNAPLPVDTMFQSVSGLASNVEYQTITQGGQNIGDYKVPQRITNGNLTLKRGFVSGSALNVELALSMLTNDTVPMQVLVMLFDDDLTPLSAWLFLQAFAVSWETDTLEASSREVLIESLELAYQRMQRISL